MSTVRIPRNLARWQKHVLLFIAFAVAATPLIAYNAVHNRQLSVYDEWQYAERVYQVSQGDLFMRNGEIFGPWSQDMRACRGIIRVSEPLPACQDAEPVLIANSAATDPPPYFVATGAVTGVLLKTGVTDNPVTTGRLVGIVWAALSMWLLFLLSRAMGAALGASVVVSFAPLAVPALLQQYTYITPHALDVPVGAFAALATLHFLRKEWPWWTLVLAALGVAGVKGSNIVIVVSLAIALLAVMVWPHVAAATRKRAVVAGLLLGVSTVAFTVAWMVVVGATQIDEPPPPGDYTVKSLDTVLVYVDSIRFLSPFGEGPLAVPHTWLVMGMSGSALAIWTGLAHDQRSFVRQFAPGYLLGAALGPVVLALMVFYTSDQYIGIHARYGLALWPLGIAFLALILRTRTSVVIAAAALLLYAATPAIAGLDSITM